MWFSCVAIGAVATAVIIVSLWDKFQTNPTITGLDTDFHNWKVPFPAITVCQEVPYSLSRIEQYYETYVESRFYRYFYSVTFLGILQINQNFLQSFWSDLQLCRTTVSNLSGTKFQQLVTIG